MIHLLISRSDHARWQCKPQMSTLVYAHSSSKDLETKVTKFIFKKKSTKKITPGYRNPNYK